MAYFQGNRDGQNRGYDPRFRPEEYGEEEPTLREEDQAPRPQAGSGEGRDDYDGYDDGYDDGFDSGYDDGFDELAMDPGEEELSEEEIREEQKRKYRIAAGAGDLTAVLAGVAVILVLVAFLINMVQFVSSDFAQTFSLWATKF